MQLSVLYERIDSKLDSMMKSVRDSQTEMIYWQAYYEAGNWVYEKLAWRWMYRTATITIDSDDEVVLPWAALNMPVFAWDVSDKSDPPLVGRSQNYTYKYVDLMSSFSEERYTPGNPSTAALYSPADLTGISGAVLTFTDLSATMTQTQADALVGKHFKVGGYEAFYEISAISVSSNTITSTTTIAQPGDHDYDETSYAAATLIDVEPKGALSIYLPQSNSTSYTVCYAKRFRPGVYTTDDIDIDDRLYASFAKMCAGLVRKETDDLEGAQLGHAMVIDAMAEIQQKFSHEISSPGINSRMGPVDPRSKFGLGYDATITFRGRKNRGLHNDQVGYR